MSFHGVDGRLTAGLFAAIILSACANGEGGQLNLATGTLPQPTEARPQDNPVATGKLHYAKGSYGLAERSFRQAVEANAKSAEAWLGLAASYDRLRRFDLADRAYKQVLGLQGRTVTVLNNLAYHHMLKGELHRARALLDEAERKDPGNEVVAGNKKLLATWKSGDPEATHAQQQAQAPTRRHTE